MTDHHQHHHETFWRVVTFVVALLLGILWVMIMANPARGITGTTQLATHPSIAAQPTVGRGIDDMAVKGGRLYLGYGDYTANTGPIDIAYLDLATGLPGVALQDTPTEEVNTYRTFHGNLFTPWVDPTGCGVCSPPNGGMASDVGGWHVEHAFPAAHVYDYTELGDSRFLVGATGAGAGVWRSVSGGPWTLVREQNSAGGATGWERFYWAVTLNGKVYVQAKHNGGTTSSPSSAMFKMWSFDGTRWKRLRASIPNVTQGHSIEVFKGVAYFPGGTFNGTRTSAGVTARDWFVAGDYLYRVTTDGALSRTTGNGSWESLGSVALPAGVGASSVAVSGGYVYVGTSAGTVYRAAL